MEKQASRENNDGNGTRFKWKNYAHKNMVKFNFYANFIGNLFLVLLPHAIAESNVGALNVTACVN